MKPRLLALHGFTLNGAVMRRQMGTLGRRLEEIADVEYLDAPHTSAPEDVARLYARWDVSRADPPHLHWWNASGDGRDYVGWEETRALLAEKLEPRRRGEKVGVIGFSQGAIVCAAAAALSTSGDLPTLHFAIPLAGAPPRAVGFGPHFVEPIEVPSLHVWGTEDWLMGDAPARLVQCFEANDRHVVTFSGAHTIPRRGEAADRIVEFVDAHS